MATYSATVAPDSTSTATYLAWVSAINAAFAAMGWVQANDTGQIVLVATVLTFTQVTVGATAVYSYSSYTGPAPRIGMSVIITGFGTAGNNVTANLTAVSGGASGTVTVALTTQANETHAGSGTTTASTVPALSNFLYEIWQTSDSVGFPITVKMEYGPGSSNPKAAIAITIGTGSNGSGTILNPSTRIVSGGQAGSTTAFACHFSGDSGRMCMNLWHGQGNTPAQQVSLERSYNNSGTATGDYYTVCWMSAVAAGVGNQQTIFPTGAQTTLEILGLAALVPKSGATGNLGATTHVSPVFPIVGGLGNPMTNIMCYRGTDFSDNQVVYVTIYGVQHTYITVNEGNLVGTTMCNIAANLMMRYD